MTERAHGRSGPEPARRPRCLCGQIGIRDDRSDAYCCPASGHWLESACGGAACTFCAGRPPLHSPAYTTTEHCGGRILTASELRLTQRLGLVLGFDVDDKKKAPVQLHHIVAGGDHDCMRPICDATTLWAYNDGIETHDVITCMRCLDSLPLYAQRWHRRSRAPIHRRSGGQGSENG